MAAVAEQPAMGGLATRPALAGTAVLDRASAARFLIQTSFGPTVEEIDRVALIGRDLWLLDQLAREPTLHLPLFRERLPAFGNGLDARYATWWEIVLTAPDQLRQRVAFALSEILVVSDTDGQLSGRPQLLAAYYDILVRQAFGNYRELMEEVTLAPAMGLFLSHLGNDRPDPISGRRPDENYARELMQLFSIGLWQLNRDGSPQLDAQGQTIATYDQALVEEYARVYTGWTWSHLSRFSRNSGGAALETEAPMRAFPEHHDAGSKTLIGGLVLPAGQTPEQDLRDALDSLFQHPNLPPFLARQLIIKLVTSNPSPAFIERIARVFENNGRGVRGDLGAVVSAIFLDPEARLAFLSDRQAFGKLKEPLLRLSQLLRAFDARSRSGLYQLGRTQGAYGQQPLSAPSVFNFFSPQFRQPGPIRDRGLYSPEFQLQTETQGILIVDALARRIALDPSRADENAPVLDFAPLLALAADPEALLEELDLRLLAGSMSASLRAAVLTALERTADLATDTGRIQRLRLATTLICVSPEYAVQR